MSIKILQVFGSLHTGGAESRMMDVYRHIDRSKYSFDFVKLQPEEEFYEAEIKKLGGNILRVDSPRLCGFVEHVRQLRLCMRNGKYDAVHAHTLHHCGLVMLAAWMENIPVRITHSRSTSTKRKNLATKIFVMIGRILIKLFATKRLAISQDAGKFLFGQSSFEVLPNANETSKYQLTSPELAVIRRELNIPENAFVIGQIARFESMKNHEFTLNWFTHYLGKRPEAFLVLVGDGELRAEIERSSVKLGIADRVLFTGVRGDVPKIIHAFNVVFLPSLYEGLGGVVLEAQAAGIPAVISENVPESVDIGLGLVTRVSLSSPFEAWDEAVGKVITRPSYDEINNAFETRKLTLDYEVSRLEAIYSGKS